MKIIQLVNVTKQFKRKRKRAGFMGSLVPLWLFPPALAQVAGLLAFGGFVWRLGIRAYSITGN